MLFNQGDLFGKKADINKSPTKVKKKKLKSLNTATNFNSNFKNL